MARAAETPKRRAAVKRPSGQLAERHGTYETLRVMISSRCDDPVPGSPERSMTELRQAIKDALQAVRLLDWSPFKVIINEDEPARDARLNATELCLEEARRADVLLALVNGRAGWAAESGDVGICHLELKGAYDAAPRRIRVVDLGRAHDLTERDRRFVEWLDRQQLWRQQASGFDAGLAAARDAVILALSELAASGSREAQRGQYHSGDALAWSRLDYRARAGRMLEAARAWLLDRPHGRQREEGLVARLPQGDVLLRLHALPGPTSEPTARALVGQPFLRDHQAAEALESLAGPVHLVHCHRGITEAQAARLLGFPDAVLVSPPFGVWAADPVQKIQLLFLAQCRDETATRAAVQRAFAWLEASGEGELLVERARSRARIVQAIAQEAGPRPRATR